MPNRVEQSRVSVNRSISSKHHKKYDENDKMHLDLLEVILVVVAVFSLIAMINQAIAKDPDKSSTSVFYNPLRTVDYIKISRAEKGRIGGWFWTFLVSIVFLVIIVAVQVITGR